MSLLIEERRKSLRSLGEPRVSASRSGGGRFTRDGTHADEEFETMIPSRWELHGQPGSMVGIELGRVCARRRVNTLALSVAR
jgi:hypothetical protein